MLLLTILRDVKVRLIDAGALKSRVVLDQYLSYFLGLTRVFLKVQRKADEVWTELHGHEACHATPAAEFSRMVIARCKDTFSNSHRHMLEFWPVQLFNRSVECITIDMDDRLT